MVNGKKTNQMGKIFLLIYRFGTYKWADGRTYKGTWQDDKMHGKLCTYVWPDGKSYLGDFEKGLKNGYGEFTWASGKVYKGNWVNGKIHGDGSISHITDDIMSYKGSFIGGRLYSKQNEDMKEVDESENISINDSPEILNARFKQINQTE